MIKTVDAVIIGGGVIGTSVAYHLVKSGIKNIALLEKNLLGSGSTGKAAGLTIHQWSTEIDIRLVRGTLAIYKELLGHRHKEIFHQCGLVYLASTSTEEEYLKQSQGLLEKIGVKSEWLDEPDIRKQLPIRAAGFKSGLHTSEDGYIDPYEITSAFAASVRKNGGKVYEMTPVTGIETAGGKVAAVTTPAGTISTPTVIIAAGCWIKKVGDLVGLKLPLKPYRTQIAILKPIKPLPDQFPAVYDMNKNVYLHGETGGLLLVGDGTTEVEENPDSYKQKVDNAFLEDIARKISDLIPEMADAEVTNSWAGLCTATPDRMPIIGPARAAAGGPVPEIAGLFLAGGSNGYGFMRAGMLGKLTAELVLGRKPSLDVTSLMIARFAGKDVADFRIKQGMTV